MGIVKKFAKSIDLNGKKKEQSKATSVLLKIGKAVFYIIIVILIISFISDFFSSVEDYSNCVDNCVLDNELCLTHIYVRSEEDYIKYDDVEGCSNDLENCVNDCKSIYE